MLGSFTGVISKAIPISKLLPQDKVALNNVATPKELKALLLKNEVPHRLIDRLLTSNSKDDQAGLAKIAQELTDDDWYEVLTTKNNNGIDALSYWLQQDCQPVQNVDTILKYLQKSAHKIDILTRSIPCKDSEGDPVEYSLMTNPNLLSEANTILSALLTCSDQEKRQVILSVTEGPTRTTALKFASEQGYMTRLLGIFNSNQTIKDELTDLGDKYFLRKMATHFLGLHDNDTTFDYKSNATKADSSGSKRSKNVTYAGLNQNIAIQQFKTLLNKYRPSIDFRDEFYKIKQAYEIGNGQDAWNAYQANNLITIASGWPKHSIYIGAMQDYLVVANRGQGMNPKGGCIIYRLNRPLTLEDIRVFQNQLSQKEIEQRINSIVKKDQNGLPEIVQAIPSKGQKYGTCSIANQKALIDGLLVLLKLTKHVDLSSDPQTKKALVEDARKEYKRFTEFTRLTIINKLIQELMNSNLNQHELVASLADFCNQHVDVKKKSELALLSQIVKTLPPKLKTDLLKTLKPSSRIVLWHLEHSQTLPAIVGKILNNELYSLNTDELKEAFILSYEAYLNQQYSEEEAIKWFTVYFDQAISSEMESVILQQMAHLSNEKLFALLKADNSKSLIRLLMNSGKSLQIIEQAFKRMTVEERKQLVTPTIVRHIKEGSLLKLAVGDFEDAYLLDLLSKPTEIPEYDRSLIEQADYMPLSDAHDEAFFKYIEERFGRQQFVNMVSYASQTGLKNNILNGGRHSAGAVSFILDCLSDEQVAQMVEESKMANRYGCNLLADFAERMPIHNLFGEHYNDKIQVLVSIIKRMPSDKVKVWLSEKDRGQQSFLNSVSRNPELLPLYLAYFSATEIVSLIKDLKIQYVLTGDSAEAIYAHLHAALTINEFKEFIVHDLSSNLQRILEQCPWYENSLKELAPNEVKKIINEEPEKYLKLAVNNPSIIEMVTIPNKWEILADVVATELRSQFNYFNHPEKLAPLLAQLPVEHYAAIIKKLTEPENILFECLRGYRPDINEIITLLKMIPASHRHLLFNNEAILGLVFAVPQYASEFIESDVLSGTPELAEIKALLMIPYGIEPRIFEDIAAYVKTGDSRSLDLLNDRLKFVPDKHRNMLEKLLGLFLPVIPLEQRPILLQKPEFVSLIRDAKLLSVVFEGKSQDEVLSRLFVCTPPVLSQPHTLEYLKTLNQLIGNSHFKDLLKPNMLALYSSKPEEFAFLERHFSQQVLRDYVSQYKHSSPDEQNFLGALLAKHYTMGSQDIGDSILENIQLLCNRFSKEEVKAWLLEKDLDGYNAIVNGLHDEKLFNFITTFFTPAELTPLLIDADNNWLRAARTYPRTHVFQYLENHLSPEELARFLEPDLETTIKGMLATKQRKSLAIVMKNADPQKACQILKTHQALVAQSGIDVESLFAPAEPKTESRAKPLRLGADPAKVEEKVDDVSEIENVASTNNLKSTPNIK